MGADSTIITLDDNDDHNEQGLDDVLEFTDGIGSY
jgi:hypothetical protein